MNNNLHNLLPGIVLSILIAVFVFLGAYFFSLTEITIKMFLTINTFPLMNSVLTLNFLIFLISASIAIAMMLVIGRRYSITESLLLTIIPYLVGAVIGIFIFNLVEFFIPIIAVVIGIPLGIKYLVKKEEEAKYLKGIRSGGSGAGRIITIVAIVFALVLLFYTLPQKDTLQKDFVPELLLMTIGDKNLSLEDSFRSQLADSIASQQVATIDAMLNQQPLINLSQKNDPDAQNLIASLERNKLVYQGEAFKKDIADKMANQNMNIGEGLIKKFSMIEFVSKFAWLLYPFTAFIMIMFIGGLIIRNLTAIVYGAIRIFVKPVEENTTPKTQ